MFDKMGGDWQHLTSINHDTAHQIPLTFDVMQHQHFLDLAFGYPSFLKSDG
jgi:hypothetical protein